MYFHRFGGIGTFLQRPHDAPNSVSPGRRPAATGTCPVRAAGEQAHAGPVPEHDLGEVGSATARPRTDGQIRDPAAARVEPALEPVDALAYIGVTRGQVNLEPSRKQRHGARPSWLQRRIERCALHRDERQVADALVGLASFTAKRAINGRLLIPC